MRLGILSYVNTLPVTWGLESGAVPFSGTLVRGEPSFLNRQARTGELEVAAVSSVEVAACPGRYRIVPGLCLASRGAVQSVRLFSRLPPEELSGRRVAVTSASATSRALLEVLIGGVQPVDLAGEPVLGEEIPAVLLIGDRALGEVPGASFACDLGELWKAATGLPMVWSLWVATSPEMLDRACRILEESMAWGRKNPAAVVQEASRRTELPPQRVEDYLGGLDYRLDSEALAGLGEFFRRAARAGLVPEGSEAIRAA